MSDHWDEDEADNIDDVLNEEGGCGEDCFEPTSEICMLCIDSHICQEAWVADLEERAKREVGE